MALVRPRMEVADLIALDRLPPYVTSPHGQRTQACGKCRAFDRWVPSLPAGGVLIG
jgi:hypothetical protein